MTYNVQLSGNALDQYTKSNTQESGKIRITTVTNNVESSSLNLIDIKVGDTVINNELNILMVSSPNNPQGRKVRTIRIDELIPLLGDANEDGNNYYGNTPNSVAANYIKNPKISEGNIPYFHGELIKYGKIPYNVMPTVDKFNSEAPDNVLSTRKALQTVSMLGRALQFDSNGQLNLVGYYFPNQGSTIPANTVPQLVTISAVQIQKAKDVGTMTWDKQFGLQNDSQ